VLKLPVDWAAIKVPALGLRSLGHVRSLGHSATLGAEAARGLGSELSTSAFPEHLCLQSFPVSLPLQEVGRMATRQLADCRVRRFFGELVAIMGSLL
jgi:hypothetical protein